MADEDKTMKLTGKIASAGNSFMQQFRKRSSGAKQRQSNVVRDQLSSTTMPASRVDTYTTAEAAAAARDAGNEYQHVQVSPTPEGVTDEGSNAGVGGKSVSPAFPDAQGLSESTLPDENSILNNNIGPRSLQLPIPFRGRNDTAEPWDTAYSRLQIGSSSLSDAYDKVIDNYLARRDFEVESLRSSTTTMRMRMERVVHVWIKEHDDARAENETLIGEALYRLRETLQLSLERSSYAALPSAAACLFVETVSLQDPISDISRWGIVELISKMEWYLGLALLVFDRKMDNSETPYPGNLQEKLIRLYEAILLFTMEQSVRSTSWEYWRDSSDYFNSTKQSFLTREETLVNELRGHDIHSRLQLLSSSIGYTPKGLEPIGKNAKEVDQQLSDLQSKLDPIEPPLIQTMSGNIQVLPQLYRWAMTTQEYQGFFSHKPDHTDEAGCRVLWVTGPPGAGKTMLMRATVQRLLEEKQNASGTDNFHLAYFFCDSRDQPHSHVTQAIKSLIWQMIKSQPSLARHLEHKLQTTGRDTFSDANDFYALSTLFHDMIGPSNDDSSHFGLTYVIVDAIEELCINDNPRSGYHSDPAIDDLIELIIRTSQISTRIKWLVSAVQAPSPAGTAAVGVATQKTLRLDDQLHSRPREEIVTQEYVPLKVAEVVEETGFRDPFESQVSAKLSSLAPSNFLWVDMACQQITLHGLPWNATAVLDKLPQDIRGLYSEAFKDIEKLRFKGDQKLCCDILSTTAIAYRTLHKSEVKSLIELPPSVDLDILVKRMCSFFLTVHADSICYVHPSAREFVRERLAGPHEVPLKQLEMTKRCLRQAIAKNRPRSNTYAITNWVQHFLRVNDPEYLSQAITAVNQFFNDHFLDWAEVLTTQGLLSEAAVLLQRLSKFLKDTIASPPTKEQGHCIMNTQQMLWLLNFRQSVKSLEKLSPKYSLPFLPSDSELRQGLLQKAFPWLEIAPRIDDSAALTGAVHVLKDHGDWVRCCSYSLDGRLMASGGDDGVVRLWDAETFKVQHTFNVGGYVRRILFSSDQLFLALCGTTISIWDVRTGQPANYLHSSSDDFGEMHISPDGKEVIATRNHTAVSFRRPSEPTGEWVESNRVMEHDADYSIRAIKFSPDGSLIAYTQGSKVFLWEVDNNKRRHLFSEHAASIDGLAFSHDSKYLASGSDDRTVRVWGTHSKAKVESLCVLSGHEEYVNCVSFSSDSSRLASGSSDLTIRIWAWKGYETPRYESESVLRGHSSSIFSLDFSPDGQQLISSSLDGTARVWDISTPEKASAKRSSSPPRLKNHSTTISVVCFSPEGTFFASASSDGKICLWNCADGNFLCAFEEHSRNLTSLHFSHDGKVLVSASRDRTVCVWDTHRRILKHHLQGHEDWVRCAVVSPDGNLVASASDDRSVRVWDISKDENEGDRQLRLFRGENGHQDYVYVVAFSPNGCYLASSGDDLRILIWNLAPGDGKEDEPWATMATTSEYSIRGLAFMDDETRIVSYEVNGAIRIWNLETRVCEQILAPESQTPLFESIRFERNYLVTEIGAWPISITAPPPSKLGPQPETMPSPVKSALVRGKPPQWCPYGISNSRDWITWNKKELIFLPTQYRPSESELVACRVQGRMVVMGCDSGQVLFFKFSEQGPYSQ